MASNHTEHFNLNQWVLSDNVVMEDFNEDNRKIDAALAAGMKMKTGSYVGTGLSGAQHPNVLEFDFKPEFLAIVVADDAPSSALSAPWFFVRPWAYTNKFSRGNTSSNTYFNHVTWLNNAVTWYAEYENGTPAPAGGQLNASDVTYHYVAIG